MFLVPDPDSLVRDLDLSLSKNSKKNIDSYCFVTSLRLLREELGKKVYCWRLKENDENSRIRIN